MEADWIPLIDYAIQYGVSLSTLRRHIKANKIRYKVENGRYLLLAGNDTMPSQHQPPTSASAMSAMSEMSELRTHLKQAQEEIAELKMLVALYEEQRMNG